MSRLGISYLKSLPEWNGRGGFSLETMGKVMDYLGCPQNRIRSVHVAGTNGKGSVCAGVASILGNCGYRVGLTTSPHLAKINERIVIDGLPLEDDKLDYYANEIREAIGRIGVSLTHFEAITAIAFLTFASEGMDWMVVETGLGGRLDATNVLSRPEVAAITTIAYEHEKLLGDSLEQISAEKAGIIKPGSQLVCGKIAARPSDTITKIAAEKGIVPFNLDRDYFVERVAPGEFVVSCKPFGELVYKPSLMGAHQGDNMAQSIIIGRFLGAPIEACISGVSEVFWPARLEELSWNGRRVILDCGHNPAGIESLTSYLESRHLRELRVVFGVLESKNWHKMVDILNPYIRQWKLVTPHSSRAVPSGEVANYLSSIGINADDCDDNWKSALEVKQGDTSDILVTGSMYLIGALREFLVERFRPLWSRKENNINRLGG